MWHSLPKSTVNSVEVHRKHVGAWMGTCCQPERFPSPNRKIILWNHWAPKDVLSTLCSGKYLGKGSWETDPGCKPSGLSLSHFSNKNSVNLEKTREGLSAQRMITVFLSLASHTGYSFQRMEFVLQKNVVKCTAKPKAISSPKAKQSLTYANVWGSRSELGLVTF